MHSLTAHLHRHVRSHINQGQRPHDAWSGGNR